MTKKLLLLSVFALAMVGFVFLTAQPIEAAGVGDPYDGLPNAPLRLVPYRIDANGGYVGKVEILAPKGTYKDTFENVYCSGDSYGVNSAQAWCVAGFEESSFWGLNPHFTLSPGDMYTSIIPDFWNSFYLGPNTSNPPVVGQTYQFFFQTYNHGSGKITRDGQVIDMFVTVTGDLTVSPSSISVAKPGDYSPNITVTLGGVGIARSLSQSNFSFSGFSGARAFTLGDFQVIDDRTIRIRSNPQAMEDIRAASVNGTMTISYNGQSGSVNIALGCPMCVTINPGVNLPMQPYPAQTGFSTFVVGQAGSNGYAYAPPNFAYGDVKVYSGNCVANSCLNSGIAPPDVKNSKFNGYVVQNGLSRNIYLQPKSSGGPQTGETYTVGVYISGFQSLYPRAFYTFTIGSVTPPPSGAISISGDADFPVIAENSESKTYTASGSNVNAVEWLLPDIITPQNLRNIGVQINRNPEQDLTSPFNTSLIVDARSVTGLTSAVSGTVTLQARDKGNTSNSASKSVTVTIEPAGTASYSLAANPTTITIQRPTSGSVTGSSDMTIINKTSNISCTQINNQLTYSVNNYPVPSTAPQPASTGSWSPGPGNPSCYGVRSVFTVTPSTPLGSTTYIVSSRNSVNNLQSWTTITVNVTEVTPTPAPSYTVSLRPAVLTIQRPTSGTVTGFSDAWIQNKQNIQCGQINGLGFSVNDYPVPASAPQPSDSGSWSNGPGGSGNPDCYGHRAIFSVTPSTALGNTVYKINVGNDITTSAPFAYLMVTVIPGIPPEGEPYYELSPRTSIITIRVPTSGSVTASSELWIQNMQNISCSEINTTTLSYAAGGAFAQVIGSDWSAGPNSPGQPACYGRSVRFTVNSNTPPDDPYGPYRYGRTYTIYASNSKEPGFRAVGYVQVRITPSGTPSSASGFSQSVILLNPSVVRPISGSIPVRAIATLTEQGSFTAGVTTSLAKEPRSSGSSNLTSTVVPPIENISVDATRDLTWTVTSGTDSGSYIYYVTSAGGGVSTTTPAVFTVSLPGSDFLQSVSLDKTIVVRPASGTDTVIGTVTLSRNGTAPTPSGTGIRTSAGKLAGGNLPQTVQAVPPVEDFGVDNTREITWTVGPSTDIGVYQYVVTSETVNGNVSKANTVQFEVIEGVVGPENCFNGIDDDGDGLTDSLDPDCIVSVGGYTLKISPDTKEVTVPNTPETHTYAVNIGRYGGFSDPVTLSAANPSPATGISASLSGTTLTITVEPTAQSGDHTITVNGFSEDAEDPNQSASTQIKIGYVADGCGCTFSYGVRFRSGSVGLGWTCTDVDVTDSVRLLRSYASYVNEVVGPWGSASQVSVPLANNTDSDPSGHADEAVRYQLECVQGNRTTDNEIEGTKAFGPFGAGLIEN
ncbi:hypothetical protein A2935_00080 [Candidatus Wolfebacteria bacterium RIFCSPLOWO2_01_FULL_47_17b]|uniref:Uncharacterized protein n=1 Tax=Candidatus Wolfebacteria bacterium RIFCSPLOWO2_01_FULL_47_17b TaxID=1802558 RepID=A0A1F8DXX2_9BACT|nr:MAG: hypothetical protein A2935_00080 [Candidatus Wolfebacteria bacterium RIFCSPLOWO2_01_FULL_47_17b]